MHNAVRKKQIRKVTRAHRECNSKGIMPKRGFRTSFTIVQAVQKYYDRSAKIARFSSNYSRLLSVVWIAPGKPSEDGNRFRPSDTDVNEAKNCNTRHDRQRTLFSTSFCKSHWVETPIRIWLLEAPLANIWTVLAQRVGTKNGTNL